MVTFSVPPAEANALQTFQNAERQMLAWGRNVRDNKRRRAHSLWDKRAYSLEFQSNTSVAKSKYILAFNKENKKTLKSLV